MALYLCPGFRTLSDDLLFCLRRLVRLRRVGVLTLYGLLELHFDRLKESLADACSWRLRIPRFVSRIPSRGHTWLILWLVSGNQPEPAVPDVESAKETALHSADHPLAHRIFVLPVCLLASLFYNFFVRPTKHRRWKEKLMCQRCGAMIENELSRGADAQVRA
jgi:hypothetical protein